MALNQATNITPSLSGAFSLGNGVVDVSSGVDVMWQVNGQSAMTAYQVTIYQNNAESTELYTTEKVVLDEPFYGKDALGNFVFFGFTIPASALEEAEIVNGGNYKFSLRQWWGETDAESVLQSNAAAFITRAVPELRMNAIAVPVAARKYTFSASYSQEQGDALNWVRWQIALLNDIDNPIYDTQSIYTAILSCTYDGFFSGETAETPNYAVRCRIQTMNGVEADTGWVPFSVYYTTVPSSGFVTLQCDREKDAVAVSWPRISSIPGTANGEYRIVGGVLELTNGSSVRWNTINGAPMDFAPEWSVLWKGTIYSGTGNVFSIFHGGRSLSLRYDPATKALRLYNGTAPLGAIRSVESGSEITMILTPTVLYWRILHYEGQLYPSEVLYPSETLYPSDGAPVLDTFSEGVRYPQGIISGVYLNGPQSTDYLEILSGFPTDDAIHAAWQKGEYSPVYTLETYFLAPFSAGLNAGLIAESGDGIDGYTVYRQRGDERIVRVADVPVNVTQVYDYTIRNQRGPYQWSVYARSESSFVTDAIESPKISPCFWDWSLLDCEAEGGYFRVKQVFRFRLNVETGAISNNNEPTLYKNFTPYPTVMRAPQNYKSGTLKGLIGGFGYAEDGNYVYSDTIALRDAIMALPVSSERLFLRSRKGDLLEIQIAGEITMETMDASAAQAQTANVPWAEVADASDVSLIAFEEV